MKRSEMVRQIGRELRAQSSGHCDIDPDQLLSVIEAAGMLPPKFYDKYDETYMTVENTLNCGNLYGKFTWEPEDE